MAVKNDRGDLSAIVDWFEERPINKKTRDKLAQIIGEKLSFVGAGLDVLDSKKPVKMLDYACGQGFLSWILYHHVNSIVAVDVSQVMIQRYMAKADELGLDRAKVHVIVGNLLVDPPEPSFFKNEEYYGFDLITVGAALHHFPSPADAIERLAERVRPGGVIYIQDLYAADVAGAKDEGTAAKRPRGFSEGDLSSYMKHAGLVDFGFEVLPSNFEMELPNEEVLHIQCFIARAMKPLLG